MQQNRIWLASHLFSDDKIVTAGYIFMKSPYMTHMDDYIINLKHHLLRQDYNKRSATTMDSSDDEADENTTTSKNCHNWQSIADVPHMEIMRRFLTVHPETTDTSSKTLQVPVLELKCAQMQLHLIRELLLKAKLSVRTYGIFIPSYFLTEAPTAVYNTAVRHNQFLNRLKVIPVSGLHKSTLDLKVPSTDGPPQFLYQTAYNTQEESQEEGSTATYLFASIEASNYKSKYGKWYFLTTAEKYQAAVSFIDNQLIEIYQQAGCHKLAQTKKMPFSRGPHRLTKLSEDASHHVQQLQTQVITGPIQTKVHHTRRPPIRITYDAQNFPPLPQKRAPSRTPTVAPGTSNSPIEHESTSEYNELKTQMASLEAKVEAQNERMQLLQQQLTEQQQSLQKLHHLTAVQQQTSEKFHDALNTLNASIASLQDLSTKILQNQQSTSSPRSVQPLKRAKFSDGAGSPSNRLQTIATDPMDATDHWEDNDPNMSPPHSRASSPSL